MMDIFDIIILATFIMLQFIILFFVFFLLRKRQLWALIRAGLSGHGTIVQKILPDAGAAFFYSGKPVEKVPWVYKNKEGKVKKAFTPIEGIKHHLAGTAIALHIVPYNAGSNISILKERDKELTAKESNEMAEFSFINGFNLARKMYQQKQGFNFDMRLLIIIGVIAVVAFLAWPSLSQQIAAVGG